jgi:phage tail-like protein
MPTAAQPKVISAARFILSTATGNGKWSFQEMSSINMEVEPHEFIYCKPDGSIEHTKQFGKTKPPSVTLKKMMDEDTTLWGWHMAVQLGSDAARIDCSLFAYKAGTAAPTSKDQVFEWKLINAWPSKIDLAGLKANSTDTPLLTVTLACDWITIPGTPGNPAGGIPGGSSGA